MEDNGFQFLGRFSPYPAEPPEHQRSGDDGSLPQWDQEVPPLHGLGFRNHNFINFYYQSLYWLVHHVGLAEVATEFLKDGEPVLYGQLTTDELNRLMAEGRLSGVRRHSWGISWPFQGQPKGGNDDFSRFSAWREQLLAGLSL